MPDIKSRMIRAARLDAQLYEDVEHDHKALGQATTVVVLSSVAAGIGTITTTGIRGIVLGTVGALIAWYIWAWLTYLIGTKLLPEPQTEANLGEMLRTIGFSASPGILRALGAIPGARDAVFFVATIWMLVAMVVAVRQALDYESTWRAVGVCALGFMVQWIVLVLLLASLAAVLGGGV